MIAAVLAMLASAQVAAATLTVRQQRAAGSPVARVDDVVHARAAGRPGSDRRAGGGQAAGADRDRLTGRVGRGGVIVGDPDPPAVAGRPPGDGDVAAEADQDAAAQRGGDLAAQRSAAQALAVAPRSSWAPLASRTAG